MTETHPERTNHAVDRLYDLLIEEEDARVCKDIPESACNAVPANFFLLVASGTLTKLGDEIANPKTVLTWLIAFVGAPAYLAGALVPIREAGSMLPQLLIAAAVRHLAVRKWAWVLGSVLQAFAIMGIGLVALSLTGATAGWSIVALVIAFSLARGLCSVAHKDVVGKTVPKTRRGRMNGISAAISGLLALAVGFFLFSGAPPETTAFYGSLIVMAGALWLLGAGVFARVQEVPGATEGGGNAIDEAFRSLGLLRTDTDFRTFVIVRSLMLCSALSAPFFVLLATRNSGAGAETLGLLVIANGMASSVSAPVWGRLADASSRDVMIRGSGLAAGLGIALVVIAALAPTLATSPWLYAAAFLGLGVAHAGVRLGRKTYILDLAGGQKRSDYVAVSNTVIGAVLLAAGFLGALLALMSTEAVILLLSVAGIAGAMLGRRLPQVT